MKLRRHEKILELIGSRDIDTQEGLLKALSAEGFDVTQATVSRDIKELRLVKTLSSNGEYKYTTGKVETKDISSKFYSLFADSVLNVCEAGNLCIVKTPAGLAQAVCAAMDPLEFKGIAGTIAGDDTIFIACVSDSAAQELTIELKKLLTSRR